MSTPVGTSRGRWRRNALIFEDRIGRWRREARYLITDWGGSMGDGAAISSRARDGTLRDSKRRQPSSSAESTGSSCASGTPDSERATSPPASRSGDVAWLCRYLGRITDAQLEDALAASGASAAERHQFTRALRDRIAQLLSVAA